VPNTTLQFLNYISGPWDQSIPLRTLWTLQFDNLPRVMAGVDFILGNTERTNSSVSRFPINFRISNSIYGNSTVPTLLAQKIEFPNDSVGTSYTENENMGGLIGGYYARQREPYNSITVNFLETNKDIIDFIMRPWVIAVSHKGLIEDGETFIKTDIIANMYSKFSENNWALRKTVVFEGAAPVTVPGDNLNYESSDNSNIIKPCTFTYKRYYITDGTKSTSGVGSTDVGGALAAEANVGAAGIDTQGAGATTSTTRQPQPTPVTTPAGTTTAAPFRSLPDASKPQQPDQKMKDLVATNRFNRSAQNPNSVFNTPTTQGITTPTPGPAQQTLNNALNQFANVPLPKAQQPQQQTLTRSQAIDFLNTLK
jgi:hypothetical protein